VTENRVPWREWGEHTLREAEDRETPILLFLVASWCRFCRAMERETFGDPEVREAMREYVAVRVDKDRRPDLDRRYNQGGWPTTAFLAPDGALVTGGTYFDAEELLALLRRVKPYWQANRERIRTMEAERVRGTEEADRRRIGGRLDPAIPARVEASLLENFDEEFGGFGKGQKFPHPEVIDFALVQYAKSRSERLEGVIRRTLDSMAESPLHDAHGGGFFRLAASRDWRNPLPEKTIEGNAGLLQNYLEAYQIFGKESYRSVAAGIVGWVQRTLRDPETGGLFASEETRAELGGVPASRVDRVVTTDRAAQMIPPLLRAGIVLREDEPTEMALDALAFLVANMIAEGRGAYHYHDGAPHMLGLLADAVHLLAALVATSMYAGDNRHLRPAEDLADHLLRSHASPQGGFYDVQRGSGIGRETRIAHRSILENAAAAEALLRLALLTRRPRYRDLAEKALEAFAEDYPRFGYFAAPFARAVDLLEYPPLEITIVGNARSPAARALLEAALSRFLPSKAVQLLDPERDAELLRSAGFPAGANPIAFVCCGRAGVAQVEDPAALGAILEEKDCARRPSGG
jgi:hypothetical protein